MRHVEQVPQREAPSKRETAFTTLQSLNDHLETMTMDVARLLAELDAAKDILRHAEATGAGKERIQALQKQAQTLRQRALNLTAAMKPLEQAAEQAAEQVIKRQDIAEA